MRLEGLRLEGVRKENHTPPILISSSLKPIFNFPIEFAMLPTQWTARLPWMLVALAATITALGLCAIARAEELGLVRGPLASRQAVWVGLGLVAMVLTMLPNYRMLCRHAYVLLALSLVLLAFVYAFPEVNGARRWIRVGPIGFQPSELAKITFVLALARWLMYRDHHQRLRGLMIPLAIAMVPMTLILREPDLGTAMVFLPVLFVMLFVAGARKRDLAIILLTALLATPLAWTQMSREQRSRVTALFQQNAPERRPTTDGFHLHRAKQMLALGGMTGSYFGGDSISDRSAYFVPEAATDSILTIVGERFGLLGVGLLLSFYTLWVWRGLAVAAGTQEPFGRLVAAGIVTLVATSVVVNAGMMVGLLPITGLSLPLVSYGGSGLLAQGIALGLLCNIAIRPGYEMTGEPFRRTR